MGSVKLNEEAIVDVLYEGSVKFDQYGIDPEGLTEAEYAKKLLERLDQMTYDVDEERTNQKVFRAAVRAIGSTQRKWTTFLKREGELERLLGGYDPEVAMKLAPEDLREFFPGQTGGMNAEAVLAWAQMLVENPSYYEDLRAIGEHLAAAAQQQDENISPEEQMVGIIGLLSDGPGSRWKGPTFKKWPGMGYAIGAEFMRNLGWSGFKPDTHIERLLNAWVPEVVEAQEERAKWLVSLTGKRSTTLISAAKYSLAGLAITPDGTAASKADNLLWLLGSEIVPRGAETSVGRDTYFHSSVQ